MQDQQHRLQVLFRKWVMQFLLLLLVFKPSVTVKMTGLLFQRFPPNLRIFLLFLQSPPLFRNLLLKWPLLKKMTYCSLFVHLSQFELHVDLFRNVQSHQKFVRRVKTQMMILIGSYSGRMLRRKRKMPHLFLLGPSLNWRETGLNYKQSERSWHRLTGVMKCPKYRFL